MRLSQREFKHLVLQAVERIPAPLAHYLRDVVIDVEPMPDQRTCRDMEIDDPAELMGLYVGTPLTERDAGDGIQPGDRIVIYQRNIERDADSVDELRDAVRTTVLHEIGHHFGLDEEDLDELGYG